MYNSKAINYMFKFSKNTILLWQPNIHMQLSTRREYGEIPVFFTTFVFES